MLNYQRHASKTFKPAKTLEPHKSALCDWALGLGGEAGEVQDLIKHRIFHNEIENEEFRMNLAKELGDVLWYVAAIATEEGMCLNDIAELNRAKLDHRYNAQYSDKASADRHSAEHKFSDTIPYKALKARICNEGPKELSQPGCLAKCEMPYNLVLIGPDGAGKTTIAKELASMLNLKYHKCDYRQDNKAQLCKELLLNHTNVLYDRFYYPDELIYTRVKDMPADSEMEKEADAINDLMHMTNTIFVYVYADMATLVTRSKVWKDDYVSVEMLQNIKRMYHGVLGQLEQEFEVINFNTSKLDPGTAPYKEALKELSCQVINTLYGMNNMEQIEIREDESNE